MGIEVIAAVVTIVATVAQTFTSMQAADKEEELRNRQLEINRRTSEMQSKKQDLALLRDARAREAQIINTIAQGAPRVDTAGAGAVIAVRRNLAREREFGADIANLNEASNTITQEQIALDASSSRQSAIFSGLGGIAKGAGQLAGTDLDPFADDNIFSSSDDTQTSTNPTGNA